MADTLSRLDIILAESGDWPLQEYVRLCDEGEPIPDELRDYLASALRRHIHGESLESAFGTKRRRGGQPAGNEKRDRQMGMVLRVLELVDSGKCKSRARAKDVVAGETGLEVKTIEGYITRDGALARYLLDVKQQYESLIARVISRK